MASMKKSLAAALLLLAGAAAWAYEPSLLNLTVPSALQPGHLDLLILHRFYGSLLDQPLESFFGMALGADVGLGARFMVVPGLQLRVLLLHAVQRGGGRSRTTRAGSRPPTSACRRMPSTSTGKVLRAAQGACSTTLSAQSAADPEGESA